LSNYPNDAVPKEWQLVEIQAVMTAAKNKRENRTECLWIVDKNEYNINQMPLFANLV
jgi:hypothetical protein